MLLLTSTSDIIRIVTGSAGALDVHASWMDFSAGTPTPGRTNTPQITTATTTTVVPSPAGSTQRNVKHLNITNVSPSVSQLTTVQHWDGTTSINLIDATLLPGENLCLGESGCWIHHDAQGASYAYSMQMWPNLGATGTIAETIPRELCMEVNTAIPNASGTLFLQGINLVSGQLVSSISIMSATTAANTPTNWFFALYDVNRVLRAVSANQTTTAWAANTMKTLAMTTPYRIPTSGVYYIGLMMTATATITTKGNTARTASQLAALTPPTQGTSTGSLTTSMPDPAGAISSSNASIYAAVS